MSTIREFDFSIDLQRAILWQYNEALRLQSLISDKQGWYNEFNVNFFNDFIAGHFDLRTCGENGLYVWSIILDVPLYVHLDPPPPDYPSFGFADFGNNFFVGGSTPNGSNFSPSAGGGVGNLSTDERRMLLQIRYFQLTTNGSVTEINRMLEYVFGHGAAWVVDNYDMTMTYVIGGGVSDVLVDVANQLDIFPRPAGVGAIIQGTELYSFGFANYGLNFFGDPSNPSGSNFNRMDLV